MESETLMGDEGGAAKRDYSAVPAAGPKFTRKTILGEVRNWKRFTWLEWLFVAVASLTILIILGMSIERFVTFEQDFKNISYWKHNNTVNNTRPYLCNNWTCTNDFIFTVVLVLNIVFSALYVVHGLLQERMFAMVAYAVTIVVIVFYVVVNYGVKSERKARLQPLRLIRLVLVLVAGPINVILSSIISVKMGFFIFTTVGVNTTLIRAYKIRSFLLILQILLLQVMANVLTLSWSRDEKFILLAERVIVCLLLVLCVAVIVLGWITVMFENPWLVPVWYFSLSPYYAYFVYKIVGVAVHFKNDYATKIVVVNKRMTMTDNFIYIGSALVATCLLGLVTLALLYLSMALTHMNFKKGLKEKAPPPTDQWQDLWQQLTAKAGRKPPTSPIP